MSPSLFKEAARGKRNLTQATIPCFIKGLGLSELDGRFFTALVHFTQSKTAAQKQEHLEQMRGLCQRVKEKIVPVDHYAYYSKWYHPAIRELACIVNWKENFALLGKLLNPPITALQTRESIKLLLDMGFLIRNKDGTYNQNHPAITTGSEVISLAVRELNRQMAGLGEKAIQAFPPNERDVSSLVVGISAKSYAWIKQEIQEFKNRVIRIANEEKESDVVYNLNVQLFPLSNRRVEKETNEEPDNE